MRALLSIDVAGGGCDDCSPHSRSCQQEVPPLFSYDKQQLLQIREKCCVGIPRRLRRHLFTLKLLRRGKCLYPHVSGKAIEVRISSREKIADTNHSNQTNSRERYLRAVRCVPELRKRALGSRRIPTVILSNLRSISNKVDEVELLLRDHKPDVAVFTETWLDSETPNHAVDIDRYLTFRRDRNCFGGGIVCYISDHYMVSEVDILPTSSCETEFLPLYINNLKLLIICCYHPVWNNVAKHEDAISCIVHVIDTVLSSPQYHPDSRVVLCGDFNDLHNFRNRICSITQLSCHVFAPTRSSNCLDLIFSSYDTNVKADILPPVGRSDHNVVLWKPSQNVKSSYSKAFIRKFSKRSLGWFSQMVSSTDWLAMVQSEPSLDAAASCFLSCLFHLYDVAFPIKSIRIRDSDPAWLTPQIRLLMNQRDDAWRSGNSGRFHRLKGEISRAILKSKGHIVREVSSSPNSKLFWRSVKRIGRFSSGVSRTNSVSANDFNDYFSSVYESSHVGFPLDFDLSSLPDVSLQVPVHEVDKLLRNLKKKCPGADGLPVWVFKAFSFSVSPAITFIFNRSLKEGYVPQCLKKAIVNPIPKCPNPRSPSNFRPISLLPIVSKVIEKLVARYWLIPFIKQLDSSQFAYVPRIGSGTSTVLTLINNDIVRYLDGTSGAVRLLALDFAKAFDSLPHRTIIRDCISCGLPIQAVRWLQSYLSDRQQCTRSKDVLSGWSSVTSGVPQGSIIGPLLFCICMSSLKAQCPNSRLLKYADDVTILHFLRDCNEDFLQLELNNVITWSELQGLKLNFSKCSVTNFVTRRNLACSPIFEPSGEPIPIVKSVKILGVTFSEDMRWNLHVDCVIRKACRRIYVIRNLKRSGIDSCTLFQVYRSLIRSVITYSYPCFCNAAQFLHDDMNKVEKRVFKLIFGSSFYHDTLEQACLKLCTNLFNEIVNCDFHPLRPLFNYRNPTPRNPSILRPPTAKTCRFSRSFIKFGR